MRATVRRHPAPCRSPTTRTSRRSASSVPPIPSTATGPAMPPLQLAPVARAAPIRIAETLLEHFEPPAVGGRGVGRRAGLPELPPRPRLACRPGRTDPRRGPGVRSRNGDQAAANQRRVREREPDRAADRGQCPRSIRRRRSLARAGGRRPRRHARVLLQRLQRADSQSRPDGPLAEARRTDPRRRLSRRVRQRAGRGGPGRAVGAGRGRRTPIRPSCSAAGPRNESAPGSRPA